MNNMLLCGAAAIAICATGPAVAAQGGAAAAATATAVVPDNILLKEWTGPYDGVPPWDQVEVGQFPGALQFGIDEMLREIDAIAANPEKPTFENTIVAMEKAGERLGNVQSVLGVYSSNLATPEVQALTKEWSPKLSAAYDRINLNAGLFDRIEDLYARRDQLGLDAKQLRLLTRTYEGFVRRGAKLDEAEKAQLSQYNQQLAAAFSDFNAKLLADESTYTTATEAELAGVPDDVKEAAAAAARAAKLPEGSFAIANTRSAVEPVLSFGTNRAFREKLWRAFVQRGDNGDANDTNALIAKIVKLRADRAHLLGFETHADWRMQDTMARSPAKAMDLMMRVWKPAVARVQQEVADMKPFAASDGVTSIEPWDYRFYQEKVRKAKYDLSQDEIKPYFELNNLVNGMFWSAEQLYDLKFTENTGKVPVFQPDVRTFEVTDAKTGKVTGLFYLDTYARKGKRSGAWATTYRSRAGLLGDDIVLGSNNNNFTKPPAGQPVLISLNDAETLWHEFGHAIHYYLSNVHYPSLGGSPRDFVEYPSQVNENWLLTRPVLDKFARHYKTGEPMPESLLKKIEASDTFNQGYDTVQYLSAALPDGEADSQGAGGANREGRDVQPGLRHGRVSVLGAG